MAVIEFDKDFRVKRWTKAAEKVFGWKAEELIGKHLYEWKFVYEGDKGSVDNVLNNLSQANELSYINFNRNYTKDGKIIDCEWYNSVLLDDAGNIDSVLSLAHDITERKQAEKELQLLHQRLDLHMENSPLGLLEMDKDFRVLRWSKQAEKIFGWKEDEIINKPLQDIGLVYGEDANAVDKKLNDLAEGKIQNLINFNRNYTKDGGVIDVEWYNSAVIDENGELVSLLALAHDITDLKHAEEQLEKYSKHLEELVIERTSELELAQKELVKNERLAVLGQLTATVSHELRNPLGTIRASLYTIDNNLANKDSTLEDNLNRVERNIERCVNIIDRLLAYTPTSRHSIHSMILTNIDQWITEILDEYEFPEGIEVKRKMDAGVNVKCEKENIRRCIINVLDNACQAMTDNENSCAINKDNQLLIKINTTDNKLLIEISDTGVGIPMDKIDQIFEPLFSTKVYGVGLGLPIIKQIMEQHHGGVTINSVENEGTQVNCGCR